ncbi:MAG: hypothetical protein OEL55_04215 [Desulfobulbaceae bacterium]|nr:hypothetical protein [Desulfobulbaceae bacterium]
MADFLAKIMAFFNSTQIPTQFHEVDVKGILTNVWFMIPFIGVLIYNTFQKAFNTLVMIGLGFGLWVFTGTRFVQEISINGEIQMDKVLPVVAVAIVTLGIVIYMFFVRSGD